MRTLLASVVLLALGGSCAAQEVVYLVRHAERVDQSDNSAISAAGKTRAQRLARMLRDAGITHIFTSDKLRTMQTAEPTATALHLTPASVAGGDPAATVTSLKALGAHDRALVVGHTNTLPDILTGLGVGAVVTIPDTQFDNLFVVIKQPNAPPTFVRLKY